MERLHKDEKIASSDRARYETWKLSHNCNLNYAGSSPGVETAGATKIFSSSKEKHGLYYTSVYGDGDSKAYPAVKDIYMVQANLLRSLNLSVTIKNVGSRLRNLEKKTKKD